MRNKQRITLLLALVLLFTSFGSVALAYVKPTVTLVVNDRVLEEKGIIYNNKIHVPLHSVRDALAHEVGLDGESFIAGTGPSGNDSLSPGKARMGEEYLQAYEALILRTVPVYVNEQTYIPINDLGTNLDWKVRYIPEENVVKFSRSPRININNIYPKQEGASPYTEKDTTFVGIRYISEFLGYKVGYTKKRDGHIEITLGRGSDKISLTTESTSASINGTVIELNAPPTIYEGVTYVPLRFITEAFGGNISWDPEEYEILIQTDDFSFHTIQEVVKSPNDKVIPLYPFQAHKVVTEEIRQMRPEVIFDVQETGIGNNVPRAKALARESILYSGYNLSNIDYYYIKTRKLNDDLMEIKLEVKYKVTPEEHEKALAFAKDWVAKNINDTMSQEKKVRKIFDFVRKNYQYEISNPSTIKMMSTKKGNCTALSGLFEILVTEAGIENRFVFGDEPYHGWSMVNIGEHWYHVDVTYGLYDYYVKTHYLASDSMMKSEGRVWNRPYLPQSLHPYNTNAKK